MRSEEFRLALERKLEKRKDIVICDYSLKYKRGIWKFTKIVSKDRKPDDKIMFIRAGVHGDETAGPITLLRRINEIIDYAHRRNVKLIIYPLVNPSGFEIGCRWNADNQGGRLMSDDFVRYELRNGKLVDDLGGSVEFRRWYWSSDKKLGLELTPEIKLLQRLLKKEPLSQIAAVVDLHQDYLTVGAPPVTYQYSFGNLAIYKDILRKIKRLVPIFKNQNIGAGQAGAVKSDRNGFIVRHDGSLLDLLWRLGVKNCVAVEMTQSVQLDKAIKVNLTWILGLINLICRRKNEK